MLQISANNVLEECRCRVNTHWRCAWDHLLKYSTQEWYTLVLLMTELCLCGSTDLEGKKTANIASPVWMYSCTCIYYCPDLTHLMNSHYCSHILELNLNSTVYMCLLWSLTTVGRKGWWHLWVERCFAEGAAQCSQGVLGSGTGSPGWVIAWVEDRRTIAKLPPQRHKSLTEEMFISFLR